MIEELKKLKKEYGAAQVCVWIGLQDTRTLNQWLSRKKVPFHYKEIVKKVLIKRS